MIVIKNDNYGEHFPKWTFKLGKESYSTKDKPSRVDVIVKALEKTGKFEFIHSSQFPEKYIARLHHYHAFIKRISASIKDPGEEIYPDLFPGEGANLPKKIHPLWGGLYCTDAVTPVTSRTYEVARGSAESALTGAKMIREKKQKTVYALCRPSGHHAGPRVFGGYCYFNNTATAAHYLSEKGRVAILDTDYHCGNGTQEFFYERGDIFTCSIHGNPEYEYPYYWGYENEKGKGEGKGANLNLPLPMKSDDSVYLEALDKAVKAIRNFNPDFLVIGAGFDTHKNDPIGGFLLTTPVYKLIGEKLAALNLPLLICQEGGYNTRVLAQCVLNFLQAFLNK